MTLIEYQDNRTGHGLPPCWFAVPDVTGGASIGQWDRPSLAMSALEVAYCFQDVVLRQASTLFGWQRVDPLTVSDTMSTGRGAASVLSEVEPAQLAAEGLSEVQRILAWYCSDQVETSLGVMLADLRDAMAEEDQEDDGVYRPRVHVLESVLQLLFETNQLMRTEFPRGSVASDTQGGLRIEWRAGDKEVRFAVTANEQQVPYLYYEVGDDYDIVGRPDAHVLASWLDWMLHP